MPGRVAFVPLRYGARFAGGSEALTREIALGLAGRGWETEIWTTRVVDHLTWANDLPEGAAEEDGLVVRRFSTVPEASSSGRRAQDQIEAAVMPDIDAQWAWLSWRFRVPDLYHHILRHSCEFDAVVFSPYMFWNTAACVGAAPANAVTMPCLHDEFYARLDVYRPVLADPASVWFLAEPEHDLAHRLHPVAENHVVTGAGVHVPQSYDPEGFRRRHGISHPFLLYAGRRERDKGWDWLIDRYAEAVDAGLDGVDLLTIGSGKATVPDRLGDRVRDLGFVDELERNDAFAAALAYVQPSRMESFSRTVMEAWLAGTPVLAIEGGAVVGWHIERSGGGATFSDGRALASHTASLLADPASAVDMAERGRRYVMEEYDWPVVLDRMEADLTRLSARTGPCRSRSGGPVRPSGTGAPPSATRSGTTTLVVGSYPPVPLPSAAITLAEVRDVWAGGGDVLTVSPRKSAAHRWVRATGLWAAIRLVRCGRSASRVVLVAEESFPLGPSSQLVGALALRLAVGRRPMRLVVTGDPRWSPAARRVMSLRAETVSVPVGTTPAGLTVLGPPDASRGERALQLAVFYGTKGLGPAAPIVKRTIRRVGRPVYRALRQRRGSA